VKLLAGNYLVLSFFSDICLSDHIFGFLVHPVDENFCVVFENINIVHNLLVDFCILMFEIDDNLPHADGSLFVRIFEEHWLYLIKHFLFVVLYHAENHLILLFLQEVDHTPPPKCHPASVCVISLVIVVHHFFSFVFSHVVDVDHLCLLKFIDFHKFSEDLVLDNHFFGGSVLLVVEHTAWLELGIVSPLFEVAQHLHVEKLGQYPIESSFWVLAIVNKGTPGLDRTQQVPFFKTPNQIVSADVLDVNFFHEERVVFVTSKELRNDVLSHLLENNVGFFF
jgi:hypothetical protein